MGEQKTETTVKDATEQAYEAIRTLRSPEDVRNMHEEHIPLLCEQLRRVLIDRTEKNGGHLASNLGVVELTVAIHRVFCAPIDHIIFDVGHQCYVHKLLTGRAQAFDTLRVAGGLSGFPKREESEYDAFGTGHASTSLSAALGFAHADRLKGSDAYTVVVLGDGALTGGMIHEALNNCEESLRLIIILNENEMSISKNEGRFARLLTRLRTAPSYHRTKSVMERAIGVVPLVGKPMRQVLSRAKRNVKSVLYSNNYFESMGLDYFGPANGNDEREVEQLLRTAKAKNSCCLIHLKTVKGKGYEKAERDPDAYHGLASASCVAISPTFSVTFGTALTRLAERHPEICAITAAMRQGTGLVAFSQAYPKRFFDVGIAEEHAVTFAAGLAANGYRPVVAVYSTFLQRAYDQILHDVALQKLPLVLAIDRAGLSAGDGPTHHGIFDVAFLSQVPGIELWEPATTDALSRILYRIFDDNMPCGIVAVRYPSDGDNARITDFLMGASIQTPGAGVTIDFDASHPPKTVIVTYGRITATVLDAVEQSGERAGVVLLERLQPKGEIVCLLAQMCRQGTEKMIFCEEGIRSGGVGESLVSGLCEVLTAQHMPTVRILAIDNHFPESEQGKTILEAARLGAKEIIDAIQR